MRPRREQLIVAGNEPVGPYTLLRVARGHVDPGQPGQFFMLATRERLLPRPMSLCLAPAGELGFLIDPIGPGTRALCDTARGERITVFGPLGRGFRLDVARPIIVGGGIGMAPLPFLAERLPGAPALLGFRSPELAEASALLPGAEVVVEPTLVTEPLASLLASEEDVTPLACGPEPMLRAVGALAPGAQLAWEAPMACGYGACFGCAVAVDGVLVRLCVEGPVLEAARVEVAVLPAGGPRSPSGKASLAGRGRAAA